MRCRTSPTLYVSEPSLQRVCLGLMILNVKGGAYYGSEPGSNGAKRLSPKNAGWTHPSAPERCA